MPSQAALQAVREAIFAALTSPALEYLQDDGNGTGYSTLTLSANQVVPRAVWTLGDSAPPTPYVCFSVRGRGFTAREINDRRMTGMFWVVGANEDQVTFVYEAVRARVHMADQDPFTSFTTTLSRQATSTQLGCTIRECIELTAYDPDYDRVTARWQLPAEYRIVAV